MNTQPPIYDFEKLHVYQLQARLIAWGQLTGAGTGGQCPKLNGDRSIPRPSPIV
jgi:hypothetical protein